MNNRFRYSLALLCAFSFIAQSPAEETPKAEWLKHRMSRIAAIPDALQNPGFEETDTAGKLPGWTRGVHAGDSYRIELDGSQVAGGKHSLIVENTGRPSWGGVSQIISATHLAGREIELSVQVMAQDVTPPGFLVALKTKQAGLQLGYVKTPDGEITGDTGWKKFSLHTRLPKETTHLEIDLFLQGDGRVWVDDVRLDMLDEKK